ncbi:hypothetical protein ACLOJK_026016 [Asimina triloba]
MLLKETHGEEEDAPAKSRKNASEAGANYFGWSTKDGFLFNPSPVLMSNRSLEMCTEILGSETGTSYYHFFDEIVLSSSLTSSRRKPDQLKKPEKRQEKKELPPPLTIMTGKDRIRLKPQREDGRLVIEAVAVPNPPPPRANFLQARRSSETESDGTEDLKIS